MRRRKKKRRKRKTRRKRRSTWLLLRVQIDDYIAGTLRRSLPIRIMMLNSTQ